MARERKAREEAEAVLADTTRVRIGTALAVPCAIVAWLRRCARGLRPDSVAERALTRARHSQAYSALREHQALVQSEQGELQATISQMRDEIKAKDAELAKLKPDHRPSFWSEPKQARAAGATASARNRSGQQQAAHRPGPARAFADRGPD
jgi:hypothetical protein